MLSYSNTSSLITKLIYKVYFACFLKLQHLNRIPQPGNDCHRKNCDPHWFLRVCQHLLCMCRVHIVGSLCRASVSFVVSRSTRPCSIKEKPAISAGMWCNMTPPQVFSGGNWKYIGEKAVLQTRVT